METVLNLKIARVRPQVARLWRRNFALMTYPFMLLYTLALRKI